MENTSYVIKESDKFNKEEELRTTVDLTPVNTIINDTFRVFVTNATVADIKKLSSDPTDACNKLANAINTGLKAYLLRSNPTNYEFIISVIVGAKFAVSITYPQRPIVNADFVSIYKVSNDKLTVSITIAKVKIGS